MQSTLLSRAAGYVDMARQVRRWNKSTDDVVRENARAHLAARMGRLRGLPQKIGQILSMSNDAARAASFSSLTDHAEPLAFEEIEPILREAWGRPVDDVVARISTDGLAASLGQVHRATLQDGREVAIKVQYPGIRKAVMSDLRMLGWLSGPVGELRRGFDLSGYRAEILRDLEDELDYRQEAAYQARFDRLAAAVGGWTIPRVIGELSSDRVLVSEWIDGDRIEAVGEWSPTARFETASALLRGFLHQLFHTGLLHADPHAGNYRFQRCEAQPRVVLYDFGSVAELEPRHQVALLKLIEITMWRRGDPYKPLVELGFNAELLEPIRGKLAALCATLFEPFCTAGKYDVGRWNCSKRVEDILEEDRWNFRMSGPAWFVFVMRAFRGLTYYLERVRAPVSWSNAIQPYLAEHRAALDGFDVSTGGQGTFEGLARHLRIRVTEKGEAKAALTFPAAAIDDLDELMDDGLRERIAGQGIELPPIVRRARFTAYAPQELFRLDESATQRGVRVWLE